jgi:parallel beta-helix repeat protein
MLSKGLAVAIIILLLSVGIQPVIADIKKEPYEPLPNGNTLYVGGSGEGNYTTIQKAVNAASDGDTVFVYDDSSPYYENVRIQSKSIYLIGENKDTTIIKDGVDFCDARNVKISGFTARSIDFGYIDNATISNNNIIGDWRFQNGIDIYYYNKGVFIISNNVISNYEGNGIDYYSENLARCEIINNTISNNVINGLQIEGNHNHLIFENTFLNNYCGLDLTLCQNNNISKNTFKNNRCGIKICWTFTNIINQNNFINNERNACFEYSCLNRWKENFWDDWIGLKYIILRFLPYYVINKNYKHIDWRPAKEPYDI